MTKKAKHSKSPRVLVLDDELSMAEMISDGLAERGYDAVPSASSRDAAQLLDGIGTRDDGAFARFDAVVTDLRMPGIDGLEILSRALAADPTRPVIVMTAYSAIDTAIESIRRGAYHYLTKPFKVEELALFLDRALDEASVRREAKALKRALRERFSIANLVGKSAAMREAVDLVERVADTNVPVLVLGETGTGKGVVARAIHAHGARERGPFVAVNCAALPDTLLESELFGHTRGAFTGATSARVGLIEGASHGTLFLDEIGEMSPPLQAKLLHVLESNTVRPLGATREVPVDVRVVAATHRDLRARVASGAFREDLLYRLEVVTIEIPPLRARRDDLPDLIAHFLARSRERHPGSKVVRIPPAVLDVLAAYAWPGNVRELEHVVERLVILGRSEEVTLAELPKHIVAQPVAPALFGGPVVTMRELQRRYAAWAFEALGGRKMLTAETLDIDAKTLARLLARDG